MAPIESQNTTNIQSGAHPISIPSHGTTLATSPIDGEASPTGVTELVEYPNWIDGKDVPSWYAKGADVDALLDVADSLDWLADTGDLNEVWNAPADDSDLVKVESSLSHCETQDRVPKASSVTTLPHVDSNLDSIVPSLPDMFDGSHESTASFQNATRSALSSSHILLTSQSASSIGVHLQAYDSSIEDEFVSTLLDTTHDEHGELLQPFV